MAITRLIPWSKLMLLLFVCLSLALKLNQAARVPSDQFVFPSESKPNATAIRVDARLREIEREMEEVTKATNISFVISKENKKGAPRTTGSENDGKIPGSTPVETRNVTGSPSNSTREESSVKGSSNTAKSRTASETKMITFGKESESDKPAPWDRTEATIVSEPSGVIIGPRIVLETLKMCPDGTTLTVNDHCRKIA
ncbi:uncharacterized protein LOC108112214 [Drosophila eugracilis]|uniref:uncharacterized protein LOC108112214 n=1 Tax=Drosophila eugracilis TaxID=29029 RepID=UPI0007E7FBE5|nr:uncharacterized protein LOC108112214 [Drosophila eugracilis]